jgi:hypothetical protein
MPLREICNEPAPRPMERKFAPFPPWTAISQDCILLRDKDPAASPAMGVFRTGMPVLNQVRAELGLAPLGDLDDLVASASRVLVCTSPSYDFAAGAVPGNVRYIGSQLDDADGGSWDQPWAGADTRPLVLVSLSSTVMGQEGLLQRAVSTSAPMPPDPGRVAQRRPRRRPGHRGGRGAPRRRADRRRPPTGR